MARTQIIPGAADSTPKENEAFRKMIVRQEGMLSDKDTLVGDMRDGYDTMKRRGLDTKAAKECIKWRKKGVEAYQAFTATVMQYMLALGADIQGDLFANAMKTPLRLMPLTATERSEQALSEMDADAQASREEGEGEEAGEGLRPIGEVAETVVETVGEMVRQNDAEAAAAAPGKQTATPDEQSEAKLAGEAAGSRGLAASENPHQAGSVLFTWWLKGYHPAYQAWKAKNPTVAPIKGASKRHSDAPQSGFVDRNPRMSAKQAAALLGGDDSAA